MQSVSHASWRVTCHMPAVLCTRTSLDQACMPLLRACMVRCSAWLRAASCSWLSRLRRSSMSRAWRCGEQKTTNQGVKPRCYTNATTACVSRRSAEHAKPVLLTRRQDSKAAEQAGRPRPDHSMRSAVRRRLTTSGCSCRGMAGLRKHVLHMSKSAGGGRQALSVHAGRKNRRTRQGYVQAHVRVSAALAPAPAKCPANSHPARTCACAAAPALSTLDLLVADVAGAGEGGGLQEKVDNTWAGSDSVVDRPCRPSAGAVPAENAQPATAGQPPVGLCRW